eukprot:TRINITY_DN34617_c0_g1_i1.p1 TRINITY_DN34617_c0_g1~~TRINITY_DN34617_c0_g1_i1.p1  ORF type:complete len:543 (+),score=164.46 TRINITY_DN34617_c0_g1_i1:161-1789(+)
MVGWLVPTALFQNVCCARVKLMGKAVAKRIPFFGKKTGAGKLHDQPAEERPVPLRPELRVDIDCFQEIDEIRPSAAASAASGQATGPSSDTSTAAETPPGEKEESAAPQLPKWCAQRFSGEVAALCSDLSGFTSTTRKYGIVHFASIIVRKRQLCLPILKRHNALHVTTEADNLIVAFRSPAEALKAALEMQHVLLAYNKSLEGTERSHFQIKLNGIGVHCGENMIVDTHGNLLGEAVRGAYRLGEDVTKDGIVLASPELLDRLRDEPWLKEATIEDFPNEEDLSCFQVTGVTGLMAAEEMLVSPDDARFVHPGLLSLAKRHSADVDLPALDQEIAALCMRSMSVLMFSINLAADGSQAQSEIMQRKTTLSSILEPVLVRCGGTGLEDMLWVFSKPEDALRGAVEARRALATHQSEAPSQALAIDGYGIHTGPMLFVEGTDVHWGDPVNTASKLGQDLATEGQLLVMPEIKAAAEEEALQLSLRFEEKTMTKSKVEFTCYCVHDDMLAKIVDDAAAEEAKDAPTQKADEALAPTATADSDWL